MQIILEIYSVHSFVMEATCFLYILRNVSTPMRLLLKTLHASVAAPTSRPRLQLNLGPPVKKLVHS